MTTDPMLVRAGDTLVVCFAQLQTEAEMEDFAARVREGLPGVQVACLEGVSGLAVFRPGAPESPVDEGRELG